MKTRLETIEGYVKIVLTPENPFEKQIIENYDELHWKAEVVSRFRENAYLNSPKEDHRLVITLSEFKDKV